jgi:hypothetical protein
MDIELELIQTQMAQKPMLRAEVGMRIFENLDALLDMGTIMVILAVLNLDGALIPQVGTYFRRRF